VLLLLLLLLLLFCSSGGHGDVRLLSVLHLVIFIILEKEIEKDLEREEGRLLLLRLSIDFQGDGGRDIREAFIGVAIIVIVLAITITVILIIVKIKRKGIGKRTRIIEGEGMRIVVVRKGKGMGSMVVIIKRKDVGGIRHASDRAKLCMYGVRVRGVQREGRDSYTHICVLSIYTYRAIDMGIPIIRQGQIISQKAGKITPSSTIGRCTSISISISISSMKDRDAEGDERNDKDEDGAMRNHVCEYIHEGGEKT
jgi:hypothetical protein